MTLRRRLATLLLALAAALAVAACGGGGEDRTQGLTPAQVLERAREAAAALTSYRADIEATLEVRAAPGALPPPAGLLLGRPVTVTGQAAVRRPDALSLDFAIAGLPFQANLTKAGDALYVSVLGNDFQLDAPADEIVLIRPAELAPALVNWVADPREAGREEVGGAETVHLVGGLDADAVVDDVAGLLRQVPGLVGGAPDPADVAEARRQARAALRGGRAEVWVGVSDLRPRRVRVAASLRGGLAALPGVRAASLELAADLSGFDDPVDVRPPSGARRITPDELLGVLGVGGRP